MKIYRLDVNEVVNEGRMAVIGSYVAPRNLKRQEFYASKEKAEVRADMIRESIKNLLGWFPSVECIITEIEVIE